MADHEYVKGVSDCACEDAESHAPCLQCGASPHAYPHVGDASPGVEIETDDSALSDELND